MHMLRWGNVKNAYSRNIYNIVSSISKAELHRIPKLKRKLFVCACTCVYECIQSSCQTVEVLGGLVNYRYEAIM